MKLEFCRQIFENNSNIKFHQILPVGAELFHADRRAYKIKLIVAFRNFENAPKNSTFCPHSVFVCFVRISEQTGYFTTQH